MFHINLNSKGISLYLSVIIMAILLAIALGISTILLGQIRMVRGIGDSVVAFFAADTGMERALYEGSSVSGSLDNGASYVTTLITAGETNCPSPPAANYCIKSVGTYSETKRAIEVIR